jgi:OFA family oxalate/formate antiporter-like MFS transporter
MNLTKKRWLVLTASCIINLCIGSLYAWSVLAGPMAEYLSQLNGVVLTARDLSIVFIVANSVGPITMITGGKINDTFGPKVVIFVGGLMFGGGMFLSGFAHSVGFLILTYSILLGLGLGMVYGATISTAIKFFPDKRGLVGGLTTATFGISSVVIPPIATMIISFSGPTAAFKIIGAVFTVFICGAAFFMEKCPADFIPDGWVPPAGSNKNIVNMDWKAMLKQPIFYVMIILLTCGAFAALMFIPMAAPLAKNMMGMSVAGATAAVSTLALFNVIGRIFAGVISDKIGRINTLALACVTSVIGLLALISASGNGNIALFYVGISIVGVCFGSFMGVFPGFTADQFGPKNNSVNFGIMFIGFAIAGYFGPTILNNIYGATQSYNNAFLSAIGFSLLGLVLTFVYRHLNNKLA